MANAKLYEFAVIHQPPATRDALGNDTTPEAKVIVAVSTTLAKTEKEVAMKIARLIPKEYDEKLDEVEIIIRPFAQ